MDNSLVPIDHASAAGIEKSCHLETAIAAAHRSQDALPTIVAGAAAVASGARAMADAGPAKRSDEGRRASDRRRNERRGLFRRRSDHPREVSWAEQRAQFLTRYLFGMLGIAYFNFGDPVARPGFLLAVNLAMVVYLLAVTAFFVHAHRHPASALRLRLAMWTDLVAVSCTALADSNAMSPAYLVYVVIILGNGMRYGMRSFAEAIGGSFLLAMLVLAIRFNDYLANMSVATVFFIMFIAIIILYAYSLMLNVDRARRQLELASANDMLTGLLNRRGFYQQAEALIARAAKDKRNVAILFTDLDGFKGINDKHGHHVGDRVLQQIASCINACIRTTDVAARFGGDEFVIVLPDAGTEEAAQVAQRLQGSVATLSAEGEVPLSISIGMGVYPADGDDLDKVLQRVDSAMYRGKTASGGGSIQRTGEHHIH